MNKDEIEDLEHTVGLQGITKEAVTIEIEKDQLQGICMLKNAWY